MGKQFTQICLEEREKLFALKAQGLSFRTIAKILGRDHRTWSREWFNNQHTHTKQEIYIPCKAHEKSQKRKKKQKTKAPLKSPQIFLYVRKHIREDRWTPEEVSLRIGMDIPGASVSTETIYQYIYNKGKEFKLYEYLPQRHKKRRVWNGRRVRSEKITGRVLIDERSEEINQRSETGHWEVDLMEGSRKSQGVVQAFVERKTRYLLGTKLKSKHSSTAIRSIKEYTKQVEVLSVTSDNGTENSKHQEVDIPWYFCRPYHSWEKGTVENTIGRLRRFFPKGSDLSGVSQKDLDRAIKLMNNTPRKCLKGLKPSEVFKRECGKIKSSKWGIST